MRIIVTGGISNPILLDTKEATGLIIAGEDNKPNTIYKLTENGKGWIRFTKGEDKNFSDAAKELGFNN